jgi:hypothetical protein
LRTWGILPFDSHGESGKSARAVRARSRTKEVLPKRITGKRVPNYAAPFWGERRKLRFSEVGRLSEDGAVSTTKYGSPGILKEGGIRLKEENFQRGNKGMLYRQSRKIKNPGVLLDKSQKVFFIGLGEVFPDQQIDFLIIGIVKVGHI